MKAELIQEFQLLQQSRANKFTGELADKFMSSVNTINDKMVSSWAKRGKMLIALDMKLNLETLKKFRKKYLK